MKDLLSEYLIKVIINIPWTHLKLVKDKQDSVLVSVRI